MDVFDRRRRLVDDYSSYIRSFIQIRDERLQAYVQESLQNGLLWPDALIQLNPYFEPGAWIDELVTQHEVRDPRNLRCHTGEPPYRPAVPDAPRSAARTRLDAAGGALREVFDTHRSSRSAPPASEPKKFELVSPPAAAPALDIGLGEVSNDLSARVRVNGRLGVLLAETPAGDGKTLIMVHYDGEAKPRKFKSPPAIVERLL